MLIREHRDKRPSEADFANVGTLRVRLACVLLMRGLFDEAAREAQAASAQDDLPVDTYAVAARARILALLAGGEFGRARRLSEMILSGDRRCGGDDALAGALTCLAFLAWNDGSVSEAMTLLRAAVQRADRGSGNGPDNYPRLAFSQLLTALGEFEAAKRLIDECAEEIKLARDTLWNAAPALFRARTHLAAGNLDGAAFEAGVAADISERLGTTYFAPDASGVLASVALLRGEVNVAQTHVQTLRRGPHSVIGSSTYWWVEARLAAQRNIDVGMSPLADSTYEATVGHSRLVIEEPAGVVWLVRMAVRAGDHEGAESLVRRIEQLADRNAEYPAIVAIADHARGLLDGDPARVDDAGTRHCQPIAKAAALEDAGELHQSSGANADAVEHFERAIAVYEQFGAHGDADRANHCLQEMNGSKRNHSRRPRWGWDSLTPGESNVARLVAQGLTNAQTADNMHLSPYTIDFHLRQIFRKLDVRSRVDLTRLVVERNSTVIRNTQH